MGAEELHGDSWLEPADASVAHADSWHSLADAQLVHADAEDPSGESGGEGCHQGGAWCVRHLVPWGLTGHGDLETHSK